MPTATASKSTAKEKLLGTVVHYYDRLGVAIVDLKAALKIGDTVCVKRGETEFCQPVTSLQIEHAQVERAKKGDVVGLKVDEPVKEGARVVAA